MLVGKFLIKICKCLIIKEKNFSLCAIFFIEIYCFDLK